MNTHNTLRAIALATSCLVPLAAFAQSAMAASPAAADPAAKPYSGEIQIGIGGLAGTNPDQFGRYNGLNTKGLDLFGAFHFNYRDPWDSGGTRYYQLDGDNLVYQAGNDLGSGVGSGNGWASSTSNSLFNNGSVSIQAGDQGSWGVGLGYDAITYTGNVIDSLYTVNGSRAFLNPGLLPYGGATSQTAATPGAITNYTIPQLAATGAMLPVQTGTRRNIFEGEFHYDWNNWTFTGAFRHEHKEGSLEESYYGWKGGTAFALPVDYDTDRYDATAAYNTRLYQAVLQYTYSHFNDNNLYVTLPWPVANSNPFQTASAYSLPPSNSAHYVTVMLGANILPRTRLNLNARVGLEKQDDKFAPNTASPNLTGAQLTAFGLNSNYLGTTTTSPDITATVYQLKVSANSHPLPSTNVRAYYGFDGRSVSLDQFAVATGGHAPDTVGSLTYSYVVPQNWFKQYLGGEAGYTILPRSNTQLTVGYRLDMIDRSNAQVGHSTTNTGSVALSSAIGEKADGRLSFDYADRSGSLSYLTPWANLDGADSATPTYSGAYYQAPMTSEAVTLRGVYNHSQKVVSSIFVQFKNENYTYPAAYSFTAPDGVSHTIAPLSGVGGGIKQDYILALGPDLTYRPREDLNFHFFYTYERLFFNNIGNGQCSTSNTGNCLGSVGYFQNEDTTSTHTLGVSGEWHVNPKLTLKADYTFSYGSVMFTQFNGVFVPTATASYQNVSNYPDINSLMNSIKLTATYKLRPDITLLLIGAYSNFHNNSWYDNASAIQGAGTTAVSILTPGYNAPNWSVGTAMAGMRFTF